MNPEALWQLATILLCLRAIYLAYRWGRHDQSIGAWVWLIIIPSAATIIYYLLAFLSDWNETRPDEFLQWGAAARTLTFLMLSELIVRLDRRRTHE